MALQNGIKKVTRKKGLKAMPDAPYERLLSLLKTQSTSGNMFEMQTYCMNELRSIKDVTAEFDDLGNILITKGKADVYPSIVAHMDTVHKMKPEIRLFSYSKAKQKVLIARTPDGKPTGIGGDDKNGVFAVLEMVRRVKNIKAALFVDEEVGCVGSSNVDHKFFEDVGYILQLDRWGNGDVINDLWGKTTSKEFDEAIQPVMLKHDYSFGSGLMTDSLTLHDDNIGVSAVNISCGYYQHHTDDERVVVEELWDAVNMAHEFIKTLGNKSYPSFADTYTSYGWTGDSGYPDYKNDEKQESKKDSAIERYMRNQKREDLTASDIYQDLYDRLSLWDSLSYEEQEEVRDDWMFLYGIDISEEEINAYRLSPDFLEKSNENYEEDK